MLIYGFESVDDSLKNRCYPQKKGKNGCKWPKCEVCLLVKYVDEGTLYIIYLLDYILNINNCHLKKIFFKI